MTTGQHNTWTSTTTPTQVARHLAAAGPIAVITHAKPDGDAAGSSIALTRSLRKAGIDAVSWFVGPNPPWLPELAADTPYATFEPGTPATPPQGVDDQRSAVIVDTGAWSQLAEFKPWLLQRPDRTLIIDHHLHGDPDITPTDSRHAAASCTEIVAPGLRTLLQLDNCSSLPTDVATPIYLAWRPTPAGSGTPTSGPPRSDWPPTSSTRASITRPCSRWSNSKTPPHAGGFSDGRSTLELARHGSVAVVSLTLDDFKDSKASPNDTGGFADKLLTIGRSGRGCPHRIASENNDNGPITKVSFAANPARGH